MPTIKQMLVRGNSGHWNALAAISKGQSFVRPNATHGELRGWSTVLGTLSKWGAVAVVDGKTVLTDVGREILNARAKEAK